MFSTTWLIVTINWLFNFFWLSDTELDLLNKFGKQRHRVVDFTEFGGSMTMRKGLTWIFCLTLIVNQFYSTSNSHYHIETPKWNQTIDFSNNKNTNRFLIRRSHPSYGTHWLLTKICRTETNLIAEINRIV